GAPDAQVELVVLIAHERLVEQPDRREDVRSEGPEGDGVDLDALDRTAVPGPADAPERAVHRGRDRALHRGLALRDDPATDVPGIGLLGGLDAPPDVVGGEARVAVHPDDE